MEIFSFAILAFIMGIKHAFDADHLLIVSNFLSRTKRLDESLNISLNWGIGHMLTAGIITLIIFYNVNSHPVVMLLENFEIIIASIMIAMGIISLTIGIPLQHKHEHNHDGIKHEHVHTHRVGGFIKKDLKSHHASFGVGIIHGLVSNDELFIVLILGLGIGSVTTLLGALFLFSTGVVLGMMFFSILLLKSSNVLTKNFKLILNYGFGISTIIYGLYLFSINTGLEIFQHLF
jgi:ABC-type nickel/cobalt efflux system permease component RcnA